ncbi:MAG: undecaprenyl-diphosphate phosphatase [Gammaproteobacteria bacterium]
MNILYITFIAVIQGLTEFLPISSSGHLLLMPVLTGQPDQGSAFDVALHLGTLVAVVGYFWKDLWKIAKAWFTQAFSSKQSFDAKMGWYLIAATIPAIIVGGLLGDWMDVHLRDPRIVAYTSILFGILLGAADYLGRKVRSIPQITLSNPILIGCAQALALVPGTSRSGITMTAGLLLGFTRDAAARFAFLMSVPVILMAGVFKMYQAFFTSSQVIDGWSFAYGAGVSAVVGIVTIHVFLRFITKIGMLPFVIYRVFLGLAILVMLT